METARSLSENLVVLLRREHDSLAEFLVALAAFDRERRWAELGHASLFYYLHRELKLSKSAAQYRKVAAELIHEVPAVVEPLRRGDLCLNSIIEVAKVVTTENWEALLPRFYGLSRREAEEVVAELKPHPAPPLRTVVTVLRTPASPAGPAPEEPNAANDTVSRSVSSAHEPVRSPSWDVPDDVPAKLVPLDADLRRLYVTVSKEFVRKLEAARDARPDLNDEQLLETGLDLLLSRAAKAKGLVDRPQQNPRESKNAAHVPAHVKREVFRRDGGRCVWRLANGEICGCTRGLQFDHVAPLAHGGRSTVDNLRVLCGAHNLEAARRALGDPLVDRYTKGGGKRDRASVAAGNGDTARGPPAAPPS